MPNDRRGVDPSSPTQTQLTLLRLACGQSETVRTIWPTYGGLRVHFTAKRSEYCQGDTCPPALHKIPPTWKGYSGVERWDSAFALWRPIVLEITESMELDFRGKWARGQEWIVTRAPKMKARPSPCSAAFVRRIDANSIRKPFDIQAPLCTVYHCEVIDLSTPSPVPGRVYLEAVQGAAPLAVEQAAAASEPATAEQWKQLREAMKEGIAKPIEGESHVEKETRAREFLRGVGRNGDARKS